MPLKFFITHSWKDIDFARRLCDDLLASGLDGFLDAHSMRPGDSIPSRIERGLKDCDVYIPVFSPDSLKSDWCDWEVDMAITMNRTRKGRPRIIPVIAKPCDVPDRLMHLLYISFVGRYDDAVTELLTKGFGLPPKPPSLPVTPPLPVPKTPTSVLPRTNLPLAVGAIAAVMFVIVCIIGTIVLSVFAQPTPTRVAIASETSATPVPPTNTPVATSVPPTSIATATPAPPTNIPTATSVPATVTIPLTPTRTPTIAPSPTPTLGIGSTKISADGATMVYVPVGEFLMGSSDADKDAQNDEKPQHKVYLDAFWIDKFEVTNALYKKCVDAGKCSAPKNSGSYTRSSYYGNSQFDNYPMINVSWDDATKYCAFAKKQAPTEAQWEKAARGTDGRIYPWDNTWDGTRVNFCDKSCSFDWKDNNADDRYAETAPVGSYSTGASPYGAMDMAGNVWEWVVDWYDSKYYTTPQPDNLWRNPIGPTSGSTRVVRGGSWSSYTGDIRAANRNYHTPGYQNSDLGFRCVE